MKQSEGHSEQQLHKAKRFYSDKSFWHKISTFAKKSGSEALEKLLILFYCFKDPETPAKEKTIIVGALGYFIMPIDAIPDLLPGGYVDDLGILAIAIAKITTSIKDQHIKLAKQKLNKLMHKD